MSYFTCPASSPLLSDCQANLTCEFTWVKVCQVIWLREQSSGNTPTHPSKVIIEVLWLLVFLRSNVASKTEIRESTLAFHHLTINSSSGDITTNWHYELMEISADVLNKKCWYSCDKSFFMQSFSLWPIKVPSMPLFLLVVIVRVVVVVVPTLLSFLLLSFLRLVQLVRNCFGACPASFPFSLPSSNTPQLCFFPSFPSLFSTIPIALPNNCCSKANFGYTNGMLQWHPLAHF